MNNLIEKEKPFHFAKPNLTPNISVDRKHIKKYDQYHKGIRRRAHVSLIVLFVLLASTIYFYISGYWVWGIIFTVATSVVILLYYLLKKLIAGAVYKSGPLIPAVITNTEPLEVAVMARIVTRKELPLQYGCKRIHVKKLPLHNLEIGERVPCAAIFGGLQEGYYTSFEPHPLCWATSDKEQIESEVNRIAPKDWERLESLVERDGIPDMNNEKMAYYDENGALMGLF